jgi:hypothetical protein
MNHRDERQACVYDWVRSTFGPANQDSHERARRFFEEAAELAQAEGVTGHELRSILEHVLAKPPGIPEQEAGGVGTTLLAYCAAKGFSADAAELHEFERVLALPVDYVRQRHNAKADVGIALRCDGEKP